MARKSSSVPPKALAKPTAQASARRASLTQRHSDLTRQWIVAAAADLLEEDSHLELTNAALAERAGIAERTVYRHFPSRDALLDALGAEVAQRLASPPVPGTWTELAHYPAQLFASFEAKPSLTRAALETEVFSRMREGPSAQRGRALERLLATHLPRLPTPQRSLLAANCRYLLTATTWNYYRHHFGFSAGQTVLAVQLMLGALLRGMEASHVQEPNRVSAP